MADLDNEQLVKRLDKLETERTDLDNVYDLIEQFIVPFRGRFGTDDRDESTIDWRKRDIFDSTAVESAETLAASIQGALISGNWFDLRFTVEELNEDDEAIEWLQECQNRIYRALNDSNFDLEASEFCTDITSLGTSIITEETESETEWKGLSFKTLPIDSCYFETDHKNRVVRFYLKKNMTALQIKEEFEENTPKEIMDELKSADSVTKKHEIIKVIYERDDRKDADTTKILGADARPFGMKHIIRKSKEDLGEEGGYYEMPSFVARWRKVSSSKWGYSPAMVCLSDVLTLNELVEQTLEALGKVIDPSTLTTERGLLSDLDLGRAGLTVVRDINDIKAYESKARFDVGELKIERLQSSIQRAFKTDQLQMKESPMMTATEVQVRYELMQRLLGPTLGRLKHDFLDPLLKRTFSIMYRAEAFPEIPSILTTTESALDIEYTGPLPRAQKSQEADSITRWMGDIAELSEAFPAAKDIPDVDSVSRALGRLRGVPDKYMNDKSDVEGARNATKKQQETLTAAETGKVAGEAMQSMGAGKEALESAGMGEEIDV
jgi:hypothetical protein